MHNFFMAGCIAFDCELYGTRWPDGFAEADDWAFGSAPFADLVGSPPLAAPFVELTESPQSSSSESSTLFLGAGGLLLLLREASQKLLHCTICEAVGETGSLCSHKLIRARHGD